MSSDRKESRHLRLVPPQTDSIEPLWPAQIRTGEDQQRPSGHLRVVDQDYVDRMLYQHAVQRRTCPSKGRWLGLQIATAAIALFSVVIALFQTTLATNPTFSRKPPLGTDQPLLTEGPSIQLRSEFLGGHATRFFVRVHNAPGILAPTASHIAIAVVDAGEKITWVGPQNHPAATAWPIPPAASLMLPDTGLEIPSHPGARMVALFLQRAPKKRDLEHWARHGAKESDALVGPLGSGTLRTQTIYF